MRHVRLLCAFALLALWSTPAAAIQRTFVASFGNDTNPCTRAAPCRAFAAALAQTDPFGEVVVLDSAGYGAVTITQSVSITAPPGVYAGISLWGATASRSTRPQARSCCADSRLMGRASARMAFGWFRVLSCTLSAVRSAVFFGSGISLEAAGSTVFIDSVVSRNNTIAGIAVTTTVAVSANHLDLRRNGSGVSVSQGGAMSIEESVIARNTNDGAIVSADSGNTARLAISRSTIATNGQAGINATTSGSGAVVNVAVIHSTLSDYIAP